jgi:hypothetical protein
MVKKLIAQGADPCYQNPLDGATPTFAAACADTENFVAYETGNGKHEYAECIRYLASCGADLDTPKRMGSSSSTMTPLMASARNGHLDRVRALVECGADVTIACKHGETEGFNAATYASLGDAMVCDAPPGAPARGGDKHLAIVKFLSSFKGGAPTFGSGKMARFMQEGMMMCMGMAAAGLAPRPRT